MAIHLSNNLEKLSLKIEYILITNNNKLINQVLQIRYIQATIDYQDKTKHQNLVAHNHHQQPRCKDKTKETHQIICIQIAIQQLTKLLQQHNKKIESLLLSRITY